MQIYLVGGAVRDQLLGRPVSERDWLVVGGTADDMLKMGYTAVGKDFPVFLHPKTKEEYALARTERKSGVGYTGFECYSAPDVTLEDDLRRRDLTINAIVQTQSGELIDPFGGQRDIQLKLLRHVSPAFIEDPLRVLRVARFAARFHPLQFKIAPETLDLMRQMTNSGELNSLVPERVWLELQKVLTENTPSIFFTTLRECGALAVLFPEIDRLFGIPNPAHLHPEIDTGIHTMMVLDQAAQLSNNLTVRFAALLHDLGKGITPQEYWPAHPDHEKTGVEIIKQFCSHWRVPNEYRDLALLVANYHGLCHRALELSTTQLLELLMSLDVLRRPERFSHFLKACEADFKGRTNFENSPYLQAEYLYNAYATLKSIDISLLVKKGLTGDALAEKIKSLRLEALSLFIQK